MPAPSRTPRTDGSFAPAAVDLVLARDVIDDRVPPPIAARLTGLGYPDAFNAVRWRLEEPFDAATGASIAFPNDLQIPHRTSAQLASMRPNERDAYAAAKRARIEWTREHWMRVPPWGGRATPGGEYRYSAARCAQWFARSIGDNDAR